MMGRPPKTEAERRTNILRIRLTPDERRKLDRKANAQGKEISTWAREQLLRMG
jgi:hypothetical protein